MTPARKLSYIGILTALAIVLAVLEHYIPLQAILPLPGLKLGIANVVTLTVLIKLDTKSALAILLIRCLLVALLFGTPVSLAMSFSGGILAFFGMVALLKAPKYFSLFGVSIIGAALHNTGQTLCAAVILQSGYVFVYLPALLLGSLLTGILIAVLCKGTLKIKVI